MEMVKLIIWDVDGTLLDTSIGLLSSTKYTIESLGLDMPSDEVFKTFVGPRIQDSLKRVFGLEGDENKKAAAIFRDYYKKGDVLRAEPYDGIVDLLERLSALGYNQMVATNKRQDFVDALLDKYDLKKFFSAVYGTDFDGKLSKKDLIDLCLKDANVLPSQAIMIGDSEYDAIAAKEASVKFLGVTYGFGFKKREEIYKMDFFCTVKTVNEISDKIICGCLRDEF